ncbi:hypothetical protein [Salinactinospora qingdaonensis]|uniref:Uncharacterized protein n=1 Tax=Salinactinospora qingdaonensis TaxID=702744 RepID=A0ABP7FTZ1_9ACTN
MPTHAPPPPPPPATAPYARRLHTVLDDLDLPPGTPPLSTASSPGVLATYYQAGLLIYDLINLTGLDYPHLHTRLATAGVQLRPASQAVTLLTTRAQRHDTPVSLPATKAPQ